MDLTEKYFRYFGAILVKALWREQAILYQNA